MSKQSYRDLIVWQKAIDFVQHSYTATQAFPSHEQYGLTNQLRRCAVSVPSNIAEGQARQHVKEFQQFIHISLGSLAEAHTQLIIAERLHYITGERLKDFEMRIQEIRKMLYALSKKLPTVYY